MASRNPTWPARKALFLCCCCCAAPGLVAGQSIKVKGGYYTAGSARLLSSSFLNATLFTHLFYAFARVDERNSTVGAEPAAAAEIAAFPTTMKAINPAVLTLISISVSGARFAPVLASGAARAAFVNSSIALARALRFDGLDLDWEVAQSQAEMDAFGSLIREWRAAATAEADQSGRPPLLLTAAVYFTPTILYTGKGSYPVAAIADSLDFVNIMCYDFHGSWDPTRTGANANLYASRSVLSADHGVASWLAAGLPPDKAVLGLTLYGRSWRLRDQNASAGLGAPAVGPGPAQPRSRTPGVFYYSEVRPWVEAANATVVRDTVDVTAYAYADDCWVSFEDPVVIATKVLYGRAKDLRGYFFWMVSYDRNWEVSTAALRAMDDGVIPSPLAPVPAPAPAPAPDLAHAPAPMAGRASTTSLSLLVLTMVVVIVVAIVLQSFRTALEPVG